MAQVIMNSWRDASCYNSNYNENDIILYNCPYARNIVFMIFVYIAPTLALAKTYSPYKVSYV